MTAVQLKATLLGVDPPVWRRVLLDGALSLADLHEVLQVSFGWQQLHLHAFEIAGKRYVDIDDDPDDDELDEQGAIVDRVFATARSGRYEYDFGDDWQHDLEVEAIYLDGEPQQLASCIGSEEPCPPEDCGGPAAYMQGRGEQSSDDEVPWAIDLDRINAALHHRW